MTWFDNPDLYTITETRVRERWQHVHPDLRRLTAALTLISGQRVTVNSGFRDYPIYGYRRGRRVVISDPDSSLHGDGEAVDYDWRSLPGRTDRERANFIANVARLLGLNEIYVTTHGHGTGAHAHVQIGPIGLGAVNSDHIGFGSQPRDVEYALLQLRQMGIPPERIARLISLHTNDQNREQREALVTAIRRLTGPLATFGQSILAGIGLTEVPPVVRRLLREGRLVNADEAAPLSEAPTALAEAPSRRSGPLSREELARLHRDARFFLRGTGSGQAPRPDWENTGRAEFFQLLERHYRLTAGTYTNEMWQDRRIRETIRQGVVDRAHQIIRHRTEQDFVAASRPQLSLAQ
jgi:hypothetical protein